VNQFFVVVKNKKGRFEMAPNPGGSAIEGHSGYETYGPARRATQSWNRSGRTAFVVKHYTEDDFNREYPQPSD